MTAREDGVAPRRVLVAMSGGVDSSVAAALLQRDGHDVVGVTLKLWGGPSDQGCCSVSDVDDARRVADQLGIDHHTFNYREAFDDAVVAPYVAAHAAGRTPNPCIECNRVVKFDALYRRAVALGFDAVGTGHHARVVRAADGTWRVARGADAAKDQSYVVHMLDQATLARTLFPVGGRTKAEVRAIAAELGLRVATKPDSQDVCFIGTEGGRRAFLGDRIPLTPGRVLDLDGAEVGRVDGVQLVTIGQRKGLGLAGGAAGRYVLDVDVATATVTVGPPERLLVATTEVGALCWSAAQPTGPIEVLAQCAAHGDTRAAVLEPAVTDATDAVGSVSAVAAVGATLRWSTPQRRVAPGQAVVFYDPAAPDEVLGGGTVR